VAVSTDWYGKQFGDKERFAVVISLGRDPHPTGDVAVDAGWGGISLWVRGRCLTRNVSGEGAMSDEVRWNLVGILRWLIDVGVRLVNEEPFPGVIRKNHLRDGCDWFNKTQTSPPMTEADEEGWFARRSDFRQHHGLRRAADDVALPNVMIRRLGDFIEVSWDNETWGTSRPDLSFVEQRGTELVSAWQAASKLREALIDATQALAHEYKIPELVRLAALASTTTASDDEWRWLVPAQTARVIHDELVPLRERLVQHTRTKRNGLYIPHAYETLVLRQAQLDSTVDVQALLDAAGILPAEPMKEPIRRLIRPTAAPTVRPYEDGYRRARDVREALGWGDEPAPNLDEWMRSNNVDVEARALSPTVDLIAMRSYEDRRGLAIKNPRGKRRSHREISSATALGHLLFDVDPIAVDGTGEHWPTAARARAFAAMLLLPDEGVRDVLAGRTNIDASDVKRVMDRFHTGPYATTYHLKNRDFIADDERRMEILRELDELAA
jgi:hypothetical protein